MIVRSEFSFRQVFGHVKDVVERLPAWGGVLADDGCWGHVPFAKACKAAGKHPVLGCRFIHENVPLVVVPKSPRGLTALYQMVATGFDAQRCPDEDWAVVAAGRTSVPGALQAFVPGVNRGSPTTSLCYSSNLYPAPGDKQAWQLMLGRLARQRVGPGHILSPAELVLEGAAQPWIEQIEMLVASAETPLPVATNIRFPVKDSDTELANICRAELIRRRLPAAYGQRLEYELRLIAEKKFADYFLVIADMMAYAKQYMLVGPARGSSAGSLVCWLTRITEIDPLRFGLIFERFIDVNRADLPDIDIDFPDTKRELVINYLGAKYGQQNVAHIGTIIRYKPKSALTDVAKQGGVPLYELDRLKDVMIERSSGDSRASSCLADSMKEMEIGRVLLAKYPILSVAFRLEDHARSAGVHAAGIIVCNEPVSNFCGVKDGNAQVDKKMAEAINILKIDALGLRTLSVIEECCEMIGKPLQEMYELPLNEPKVFELINARKFSGIFQYEGIALQSVAKQVAVDCFEDVAAITALARPGPLSGGETTRWVHGKNQHEGYGGALFPELDPYTRETFGCIVYQEQVMSIIRDIGNFSWADTSIIRKVMSNRQGDEVFNKFGEQFVVGAQANGLSAVDAKKIWKAINTFGSWAFNKSHAVAYGLLSYWTAWLKAMHPVQFAVANLRHARDEGTSLALLRELMREGGVEFLPVDPERSTHRWEFADGKLLGPLTGIPGLGMKTALDIQNRRHNGIKLTSRQNKLLAGKSEFEDYAPAWKLWHHWYEHPEEHFQNAPVVHYIEEVDTGDRERRYVVIGKLIKKNLRDLNEEKYLVRRNNRRVAESEKNMLLFHLEDDTGRLLCCISANKFDKWGKRIVEEAKLGQWFALQGVMPTDFKMLAVEKVMWMTPEVA